MDKIKHRTIHFAHSAKKRSTKTALWAGIVLGIMAASLATMLILIFR